MAGENDAEQSGGSGSKDTQETAQSNNDNIEEALQINVSEEKCEPDNISNNSEEEEEIQMVPALTEDAYSLIYAAPLKSRAFVFACFGAFFQLTVILLVLKDLIDAGSDNPLQIPPGVDVEVTVGQGIAMLLAVSTQQDLLVALDMLHQGYSKDVTSGMLGTSWAKWALATGWQMFAGFSMLTSTFILVMQSTTVIGMFLNFAALSFISEIDDVCFALAKHGFVAREVQLTCKEILEPKMSAYRNYGRHRRITFLFLNMALFAAYGYLVYQQRTGYFLCDSIRCQFGDAFLSSFSNFAGIYDQTGKIINGRVTYEGRKRNQNAMFGYCKEIGAWTFTFWRDTDDAGLKRDPCRWYARSQTQGTYDIPTSEPWLFLVEDNSRTIPFSTFFMDCNDCVGGERGLCSSSFGKCVDNECVCNEGRFGVNCEFEEPCPFLLEDKRHESLPIKPGRFELLRMPDGSLVETYDRPVYVAQYAGERRSGLAVMLYTGRRWAITDKQFFSELTGVGLPNADKDKVKSLNVSLAELAEYLDGSFHGFFSSPYFPNYVSSPTDIGTPSDSVTPADLSWFSVQSNDARVLLFSAVEEHGTQMISTSFLCTVCNNSTNLCYHFNVCDTQTNEAECNCNEGYSGALCEAQVPCVESGCRNGGECNPEVSEFCICPPEFAGGVCEIDLESVDITSALWV